MGNGGLKGGVTSLFTILLIVGGVMGWMKVNSITTIEGVYGYFKALADKTNECSRDGKLEWHCDTSLGEGPNKEGANNPNLPGGGSGGLGGGKGDGKGGGKDGQEPLSPAAIRDAYLEKVGSIKVQAPQDVSYKRSEWKHWIGTPCNTRERVLVAQGKNVQVKKTASTCTILSGEWVSPYDKDKTPITESKSLDIDHVIPLGYAAKHGGQGWSPEKKEQFANDMTQLLATSAKENRSKSDKGPGEYMPPDRNFHCQYAKIWTDTAVKYQLTIDEDDQAALKNGLQKCA